MESKHRPLVLLAKTPGCKVLTGGNATAYLLAIPSMKKTFYNIAARCQELWLSASHGTEK
jgi:hypothetical protein